MARVASDRVDPDKKIVLGRKRDNPYDVNILNTAWENIYGTPIDIPHTHRYMRFLPTNAEELAILYNSFPDIDFSDYPLEYEIAEEGGWYHDPDIAEEDITWLYAAIPIGLEIPTISNEIISKIALLPRRSAVVYEAYKITNNEYVDLPSPSIVSVCEMGCPNWPECEENPFLGCGDEGDGGSGGGSGGGGGGSGDDDPCLPGSFSWPECLLIDEEEPIITAPPTNECGCALPSNPRYPAGCVAYEDTQLGTEGIINVKVIVRDGWFTERSTYTDSRGCWRINREHSGWIRIKVKFKSDRVTIRGINNWSKLWEYSEAVKLRTGKIWGPVYNDIFTETFMAKEQVTDNTFKHRWIAAHANNSVYQYDHFAIQEGIGLPPDDLDVMIVKGTGAAAPMLDDMSDNPLINITLNEIVGFGLSSIPLLPSSILGVENFLLRTYIVENLPDIWYGYQTEFFTNGNPILKTSDDIKETFFHEYGHAAHYEALDDDFYWYGNVRYIVNTALLSKPQYGNGTEPESGRTAIIESWGSHIGYLFADMQYGLEHKFPASSLTQKERRRYIYHKLESFNPTTGGDNQFAGTTNPLTIASLAEDKWIPVGAYWDCIDNNADNPISDPISEDVVGFSNSTIFNAVSTNSPDEVQDVRDFLKMSLPSGETAVELDSLFSIYGYN